MLRQMSSCILAAALAWESKGALKSWNFEGGLDRQMLERMVQIFRGSFASLGPDVKRDLPPKQELQTATNHNKNAFFDKQGCHTFANNESRTVIFCLNLMKCYPDLKAHWGRDSHACSPRRRVTKKTQQQISNVLIQGGRSGSNL